MTLELQFDHSLLGKEHEAGPFPVTREEVLRFCRLAGEANPLYTDAVAARAAGYADILAPPTFCTLFIRRLSLPDIGLRWGRQRLHAGQVVRSLAPVAAGDTLRAVSRLVEVYPKTGRSGTMVFIVWATDFLNQRGGRVAEVRESFAVRE